MPKNFLGTSPPKLPTSAVPVRLSDGDEFVDIDDALRFVLFELMDNIKELLAEQKITNLYLAKLADENYKPEDIE